jgi:uncharacterized protein YjbI with pentapeptide repeats
LTVDFAWQASNATLIFLNDASLRTVAESGEVTLTDCDLRNARLHFANKCSARFERCQITGYYGNRPAQLDARTALMCVGTRLEVVDCDFTTRDGVAILGMIFCDLAVTKSRFTDCGHSDLKGGAINLTDTPRKITDCRFERCIGSHAGAVFCYDASGIHRCEFIACESRAFKDKRFAHIAVFSGFLFQELGFMLLPTLGLLSDISIKPDEPGITGCRFEKSSLYVRHRSSFSRHIARNCQFLDGNFIYYRNNNHRLTKNCTFKNGQVIEAELKLK